MIQRIKLRSCLSTWYLGNKVKEAENNAVRLGNGAVGQGMIARPENNTGKPGNRAAGQRMMEQGEEMMQRAREGLDRSKRRRISREEINVEKALALLR